MDNKWNLRNALFRRIFEENQRAVFSFFIGKGADREDAVDLVQDTFTRALVQIDKLTDLDSDRQRSWLFRVANNLFVDFSRRRSVQNRAKKILMRTLSEIVPSPSSRNDELQVLIQGIQSLPKEQRLILSLTVLGEMSSEMIGEQLDKPAGTVRYELHQAREKLKKIMQDEKKAL